MHQNKYELYIKVKNRIFNTFSEICLIQITVWENILSEMHPGSPDSNATHQVTCNEIRNRNTGDYGPSFRLAIGNIGTPATIWTLRGMMICC